MDYLNGKYEELQYDPFTRTVLIGIRLRAADYDEVDFLVAGWQMIESLQIERLIVMVEETPERTLEN